jgi:DNA-directed RNA polymerase subunit beta'
MANLKNNFDYIKINLASNETIRQWGQRILPDGTIRGKIINSETLNYKTFKPEMGGLFCEQIFGPIKSWECHCGQYQNIKPKKFFICNFCGVELIHSDVRRYRMGYIELNSPVTHVWYLKSIPSYLSILLQKKIKDIEEIVYFNAYIYFNSKLLFNINNVIIKNNFSFDDLEKNYSPYFVRPNSNKNKKRIGAEAIEYLLNMLNLKNEIRKNRLSLSLHNAKFPFLSLLDKKGNDAKEFRLKKLIRRIRIIENFLSTNSQANWMVLNVLPVIPAGLRPMILLENGTFITSDLNELYKKVIIRNTRLGRLLEMDAPSIMLCNEKRILQESIDSLIDNGKRGEKEIGVNSRALASLSDIIKGKYGRFRQNLLGKRVDFSGRSVIIVGPTLKLNQCGLPHEIALALFEPFIIHSLIINGLANSINDAKMLIKNGESNIWKILKNILKGYPILLNRAPTLHRLGIQAFEPILVSGRAIQLHPLVCNAFNADFDGDQMAIHIPLSFKSRNEAKTLMLAPNNFLSPATGEPIILPTQDMVLGCYYLSVSNLTSINSNNHYFASMNDVLLAYRQDKIKLHTSLWLRTSEITFLTLNKLFEVQNENITNNKYIKTTAGRILLHKMIEKNLYL